MNLFRNRLKSNERSLGIISFRGIHTFSPAYFPLILIASIKFGISLFIESRVPLQSRGGFKLRNIIITVPTLSCKLCGGDPGNSREFKNSVG